MLHLRIRYVEKEREYNIIFILYFPNYESEFLSMQFAFLTKNNTV